MKKRALRVALHARESSIVNLTVGERVQLDRLTPSPRGYVAERHGSILEPGVTTLALGEGHYFFKTLSDASLHVVQGGVATRIDAHDKDTPPVPLLPTAKGDEPQGELPSLTIT
jgi:hypothetical protein